MDNILQLMHDTLSPILTIKGAVIVLKNIEIAPEEKIKLLEEIEKKAEELNEVLDGFYKSQRVN